MASNPIRYFVGRFLHRVICISHLCAAIPLLAALKRNTVVIFEITFNSMHTQSSEMSEISMWPLVCSWMILFLIQRKPLHFFSSCCRLIIMKDDLAMQCVACDYLSSDQCDCHWWWRETADIELQIRLSSWIGQGEIKMEREAVKERKRHELRGIGWVSMAEIR